MHPSFGIDRHQAGERRLVVGELRDRHPVELAEAEVERLQGTAERPAGGGFGMEWFDHSRHIASPGST